MTPPVRLRYSSARIQHAQSQWSILHWVAFIGVAILCWFAWKWSGPRSSASMLEPSTDSALVSSTDTEESPILHASMPSTQTVRMGGSQLVGVAVSETRPEPMTSSMETGLEPNDLAPAISASVDTSNNHLTGQDETMEAPFDSRRVRDVFEAQLVMASRGISSGPIDGLMGGQTQAALRALQESDGLEITGLLDSATRQRLWLRWQPLTEYTVSQADLDRLGAVPSTWRGKSEVSVLPYETILELAAEKGWAYQSFVRRLNPGLDWDNPFPGMKITIPNVNEPDFRGKASYIRIFLSNRALQAFDENHRLLIHFPCSIARRLDKRPVGELHVERFASMPQYRFDPEIFSESQEAREIGEPLLIPPGPNNPVGVVWIGLSLPGYGIHGTPDPEMVGRTESHGCFRLANWNARILLRLVRRGMSVYVDP